MANANPVPKLYRSVIEDVINNVREYFIDEGMDEQILQELKQIWESKLLQSKAIDTMPAENEHVLSTQFALQEQQALRARQAAEESARQQQAQAQAQATLAAVASAGGLSNVPATLLPHLIPSASLVNMTAGGAATAPVRAPVQTQAQSATMAISPQYLQQVAGGAQVGQIAIQTNQGTAYLQIPVTIAQQLAAQQAQAAQSGQQAQVHIQLQQQGQAGVATLQLQPPAPIPNPNIKANSALPQLDGSRDDSATVVMSHLTSSRSSRSTGAIPRQVSEPICHSQTSSSTGVMQNDLICVNQSEDSSVATTAGVNKSVSLPLASHKSEVVTSSGNLLDVIKKLQQLDGAADSSDEEEEEDEEEAEEEEDEENDENDVGEDEEPLNSEDDVSDEEPPELFETDNVVVCQYDKITRSRNKWKFYLKDGIMNLRGRDFVFQKAIGEGEW